MTAYAPKIQKAVREAKKRPHRIALSMLCLFSLLLVLKNPDLAISSATKALALCAKTVIPSLFPFMVISELIVAYNASAVLAPIFEAPCRRLFRLSRDGSAAALLGLLCGSPIGAKCASSLYRKGKISLNEYSHLLTFSNNPSSAFLISAVGARMFGSKTFGMVLYAVSLVSAVAVGMIVARLKSKKEDTSTAQTAAEDKKRDGIALFTSAVSSSALSILYVCAFVVFFATLVGAMEAVFSALSLPPAAEALIFGFFEMTSGVSASASVPVFGKYLAAFIIGWSGLSVHFQIMSICNEDGVPLAPYFTAKLAQGLLNCLLLALILSASRLT